MLPVVAVHRKGSEGGLWSYQLLDVMVRPFQTRPKDSRAAGPFPLIPPRPGKTTRPDRLRDSSSCHRRPGTGTYRRR